ARDRGGSWHQVAKPEPALGVYPDVPPARAVHRRRGDGVLDREAWAVSPIAATGNALVRREGERRGRLWCHGSVSRVGVAPWRQVTSWTFHPTRLNQPWHRPSHLRFQTRHDRLIRATLLHLRRPAAASDTWRCRRT